MCSVPQCKNRAVTNKISLHSFPRDDRLKKEWTVKLRIGKPVTPAMVVCSEHFVNNDFFWSGTGYQQNWTPVRRRLKKNAVPSRCLPLRSHDKPDLMRAQASTARSARASSRNKQRTLLESKGSSKQQSPEELDERLAQAETTQPQTGTLQLVEEAQPDAGPSGAMVEPELNPEMATDVNTEDEAVEALLLLSQCHPSYDHKCVQVDVESFKKHKMKLVDLLTTDAAVRAFTGIESVSALVALSDEVALVDKMATELSVLGRVVLVLVRIKTCLSFICLALLFGVSKTTVHRHFYGTLQALAAVLEAAIPWPSKEEVSRNLPRCFEGYQEVRVVLDCTEVELEKSHCASCRILTYSHYKGRHTAKVLVGVSPGGLITFVSNGFGGKTSDKASVKQSHVLDELSSFEDDVMIDKGFNIDDMCGKRGLGVVQPPFLRNATQFSSAEANKTVRIARARVHVERAIQRMKLFKVLKGPVPWEMVGALDHILITIAGIVNLSSPILADKRFLNANESVTMQ